MRWFQIVIMLFIFPTATMSQAATLRFAVEPYCPYICTNINDTKINPMFPGYYIEIIQEIYTKHYYQLEFLSMNFSKAVQKIRAGSVHGMTLIFKHDAPDLFFADNPIGYERGCFMVLKEDPWRYTEEQSLEGKRLAAKHGHITGILPNTLLRQLKSIHQNHSGDSALQENLDLLHKGKVDIVLTNVDRIEYFSDYILYQQHFNPAGCIEQTTEQLVTFSPVLDESTFLVEIFNAGLENLKKTGKLNQLRRKYNITNPINQKQ